jgi:hypothetical protein
MNFSNTIYCCLSYIYRLLSILINMSRFIQLELKALFPFQIAVIYRLMPVPISLIHPTNSIILQLNLLQFMSHHHSNKCEAPYQLLPVLPNSTLRLLLCYAPSKIIGSQYNLFYTKYQAIVLSTYR